MRLFTLEHSKASYIADFVIYVVAVLALTTYLLIDGPKDYGLEILTFVLIGLAGWTAIEYIFHRFVLHSLQPFKSWHEEHHLRPNALICLPTVLSAALIVTLVFLPALLLWGVWHASAVTLGVLAGYLAYTITHHATHHWHSDNAWLKKRKRWHAIHHHVDQLGYYGVTTSFWDYMFGSTHQRSLQQKAENID
jgi:sterol desaturase/sphingolipid hydroxylase (fatty acid hydroxylase superfamily)